MVAKYLQVTAHWGICFKRSKPLPLTDKDYSKDGGFFCPTSYNISDDPTLKEVFDVDINTNKLIGFVDAAYANDLCKRCFTTGVVFSFIEGAVVYKSKTQSITASSSTEAEFIAAHATEKIVRYLWMLLKQLGYEQKDPIPIHIDNLSALRMINNNSSPTERTRHVDMPYPRSRILRLWLI